LNAKTGGVITVANYRVVPDTTPPERIKDLVVGSGNTTNNTTIFTLSWTAPGNDLNVGRGEALDTAPVVPFYMFYVCFL